MVMPTYPLPCRGSGCLIVKHGYGRRMAELEDAERALGL